jgi:hypothetical protein
MKAYGVQEEIKNEWAVVSHTHFYCSVHNMFRSRQIIMILEGYANGDNASIKLLSIKIGWDPP